MDNARLLRDYAEHRSEAAFAEFVQGNFNLVYSIAMRQLGGDPTRAREVAQIVFVDAARKAASLTRHPAPAGWLYTSAFYASAKLMRAERRRIFHEQKAMAMTEPISSTGSDAEWTSLRPVLDEAMHEMKEHERTLIVLRFFEQQSVSEIAGRFGLTESGIRKNIDRALDRLRLLLARRGITSTTAALAGNLATGSIVAAPAGMAAAVGSAALSAGGTGGLTLLAFMSTIKISGIALTAAVIAGLAGLIFEQHRISNLQAAVDANRVPPAELSALSDQDQQLRRVAAETAVYRGDADALARAEDELKAKLAAAAVASAAAEPVYNLAQLDAIPQPKSQRPPVFPPELKQAGVNGQVTLSFVVAADGSVRDASVVSSTHPEFEAPALAAGQQWSFAAGSKNGKPVGARMSIDMVFATGSPEERARSQQQAADWRAGARDWF